MEGKDHQQPQTMGRGKGQSDSDPADAFILHSWALEHREEVSAVLGHLVVIVYYNRHRKPIWPPTNTADKAHITLINPRP